MADFLIEKDYQKYIMDYLKENNGYIIRSSLNFDRYFALDRELLFKFLFDTQSEEMEKLQKIFKSDFEETLINFINNKIVSTSLLDVLKHGVEISNVKLNLMYSKPATTFNKDLNDKYSKNIFSCMEEVWANDTDRIDLVIFLNGFAIISYELKCNASNQNYEIAIAQYRENRDPKSRLFLFKAGCIVNFAMDLQEAHMTTKLNKKDTYFLPFNKGNGVGVDAGKGNPINKDGFGVSYMWEDVLTKDTLLDLIGRFIFIEKKETVDELTGKTKVSENLIFPRYHQLDCVRKVLSDVKEHHTSQNYLIQHSAGSGKTNTIAWLSHRLSSLHDNDDKVIFDNIIIVTDRVVVDRQLQKAVMGLEHKSGLIRVMDDKCTSQDLATAISGNTKIVATTIQKFPYILDSVKGLKNKHFAVIIDEAHSSTSGKDMAAVTKVLGSDEDYEDDKYNMDVEDIISDEICRNGKQSNVSIFAFTATPKATTLELFGKLNSKGQKEAFHLYSMKQAIEEGFILDVLQNFTPYQTFYKINKEIEDDPKYKTNVAKRKIARFAMLHDTNIAQRIEIIVEHFRNTIKSELGGSAKAMVITGSRAEAVKYYEAFLNYVKEKGYTDVKPIVAFSGKVSEANAGISKDDKKFVSESSLNGFSEDKTPIKFNTDDYQVLLVANKYQTGFDQPKLCAMYVLKKLQGISAVQTFSRLNRICPPWDKKTFILDFVNKIEDIESAFAPYYTTTILCNSITPELVYEVETKLDSFMLVAPDDIEVVNKYIYDEGITKKKKEEKVNFYLMRAKKYFDELKEESRAEAYHTMRKFVRFYEFLIQVSSFEDVDLHKKYVFIDLLLPYLSIGSSGKGFNLSGKIEATCFVQKKGQTKNKVDIQANPVINLATADDFNLTEDEEKRLSDIIQEVNSKTGKSFDNDVAIKAALQIRDLMLKNKDLCASAKNNELKDFSFSYFDNIDDALDEGLNQNKEFFTLLLNNESMKKEILGIFMKEIYDSLRKE